MPAAPFGVVGGHAGVGREQPLQPGGLPPNFGMGDAADHHLPRMGAPPPVAAHGDHLVPQYPAGAAAPRKAGAGRRAAKGKAPPKADKRQALAEKEEKRVQRLLRNRVSAQQARERKKAYVGQLEVRNKELEEANKKLEKRVKKLEREVAALRGQATKK